MSTQYFQIVIAAILVSLFAGCSTPAAIQRNYENSFSFDYEDIVTGETGSLTGHINSSSSLFSQLVTEAGNPDSFILQRFHLIFTLDTGYYESTEVSFRDFSLVLTDYIPLEDARVIGLNEWSGNVYSFIDPEQYLTVFFPTDPSTTADFSAGLDVNLNAYGYTTTADYSSNSIGSHSVIVDHAEIIADTANPQKLYLEGSFEGTTISAGYPTVQVDFSQGVMRITNGRFAASWVVE